jgi:hypothetical protein
MALTPPLDFRYGSATVERWSQALPEGDASGGAGRDRTGDPLVANQVLSQLSYSPSYATGAAGCSHHHDGGGGRWTQPTPRWWGAAGCSHRGSGWSSRMVGLSGFEPLTSRLSAVRSSQLSYRPVDAARQALGLLDFGRLLKSKTAARRRPLGHGSLKTR